MLSKDCVYLATTFNESWIGLSFTHFWRLQNVIHKILLIETPLFINTSVTDYLHACYTMTFYESDESYETQKNNNIFYICSRSYSCLPVSLSLSLSLSMSVSISMSHSVPHSPLCPKGFYTALYILLMKISLREIHLNLYGT